MVTRDEGVTVKGGPEKLNGENNCYAITASTGLGKYEGGYITVCEGVRVD